MHGAFARFKWQKSEVESGWKHALFCSWWKLARDIKMWRRHHVIWLSVHFLCAYCSVLLKIEWAIRQATEQQGVQKRNTIRQMASVRQKRAKDPSMTGHSQWKDRFPISLVTRFEQVYGHLDAAAESRVVLFSPRDASFEWVEKVAHRIYSLWKKKVFLFNVCIVRSTALCQTQNAVDLLSGSRSKEWMRFYLFSKAKPPLDRKEALCGGFSNNRKWHFKARAIWNSMLWAEHDASGARPKGEFCRPHSNEVENVWSFCGRDTHHF